MKKKIDESVDSFRRLRENDMYYIDKTLMLKEYLVDRSAASQLNRGSCF